MSIWSFSSIRVHFSTTYNAFSLVALFLLPVCCIIGLIGNALVCIAIATDRRLQNVTNYFLFSLALADLLVCCIVMPISIVIEVRNGVWTWNFHMCLMYVYSDVFLCSASIVHMSMISLDRYLGISQPLRNRNKTKSMILLKIFLVWLMTIIISSPIAVLALLDHTNILQNNTCQIFNRQYIIYGSTLTFVIPLTVMSVAYHKTTGLLMKQASILNQKANENADGLRRTMPHRKLGCATRTNSTSTGGYTNGTHKSSSNHSNGAKASVVSYTNGYHNHRPASFNEVDVTKLLTANNANNNQQRRHHSLQKRSTINRWKNRTSNYISSIASKTATQELANEHKASRVLAFVYGAFFLCWTPFFFANFVLGFCASCSLPNVISSLFLWLGYLSSTVNPIIYTVFNRRFRQAFLRILRCQCYHSRDRESHAYWSRNYTTIVPDTYTWSNHERDRTISNNGRDDMNSVNGSTRRGSAMWRRDEDVDSTRNNHQKSSLPVEMVARAVLREFRAATEELSDEEPVAGSSSEQRPLIPPRIMTSMMMKKSFTNFLAPTAVAATSGSGSKSSSGSSVPKSNSCADCQRVHDITDPTDTDDTSTMTSSTNSNTFPRHLTLFSSSYGKPVKETFL